MMRAVSKSALGLVRRVQLTEQEICGQDAPLAYVAGMLSPFARSPLSAAAAKYSRVVISPWPSFGCARR